MQLTENTLNAIWLPHYPFCTETRTETGRDTDTENVYVYLQFEGMPSYYGLNNNEQLFLKFGKYTL